MLIYSFNVLLYTAQHSDVFVSSSLSVPDTSLSIESTEESFPLTLNDDDVALEAPEVVILEALVPDQPCSLLQLLPYNQTQITIVDNDGELPWLPVCKLPW